MAKEKTETPVVQPKGKFKKLYLIVGLAVLVLGGGGAGAFFFMKKGASAAEPAEKTTADEIAEDAHGGGHGEEKKSDGHEAKKDVGGHGKDSGGHGKSSGGHRETAAAPPAVEEETTHYDFENAFVVNLIDKDLTGRWFLNLALSLETTNPKAVEKIKQHVPPLQDALIMLLSSKTNEELRTVEGKMKLNQEIIIRLENIVGPGSIKAVYFTEFNILHN